MGKKRFLLLIIAAAIFCLPLFSYAQTPSPEQIEDYQINIQVEKDGTLKVAENIEYNFGVTPHHGIFRTIPYAYKARGGNFNLRISNISVTDPTGTSQPYTTTRQGGQIEIKIGDPDKLVTGIKNYKIDYEVNRALNYFPDHDELYWNAIGSDWSVPILKAKTSINFPFNVRDNQLETSCFTGSLGSDDHACEGMIADDHTVVFQTVKELGENEGLTIVAGFPTGLVKKITLTQNVIFIVQDNWIAGLPILIFIVIFLVWLKFGKDSKGRGTIIPEYEAPEGLSPLEIGTLLDENINNRDISAEIIYLAINGYIKISQRKNETALFFNKEDYFLEKLKKPAADLPAYDKDIIEGIFNAGDFMYISELRKQMSFFARIQALKKELYEKLTKEDYYKTNPNSIKKIFLFFGFVTAVAGGIMGFIIFGFIGFLSLIASGLILIIFAFLMPAPTDKGALLKEKILGLKLFLNATEKDRLKFFNAPETKPEVFEKFLPYAMVLGVEKQWAKQFKDIYNYNPTWYESTGNSQFNPLVFTNFAHDFNSSMTYTAPPSVSAGSGASSGSSGFGGGGFSGGGFGGGGGGSW